MTVNKRYVYILRELRVSCVEFACHFPSLLQERGASWPSKLPSSSTIISTWYGTACLWMLMCHLKTLIKDRPPSAPSVDSVSLAKAPCFPWTGFHFLLFFFSSWYHQVEYKRKIGRFCDICCNRDKCLFCA